MTTENNRIDEVPILVGIIGHRDIPESDYSALRSQLAAVFNSLKKDYPRTPIVALTALAQGADLLGAEVADEMGIKIISPLPMEPVDYRNTFDSPNEVTKFDLYVNKALTHVCQSFCEEEDTIERKYARAGAAIVQYSHIVIALWNGVDSGKPAGTSYLVKHAMGGIPKDLVYDLEGSMVSPLDPVSTACVRQIPVKRKGNPIKNIPVFENDDQEQKFAAVKFKGTKKVKADLSLSKVQERMFERFDRFNRDLNRYRPKTGTWAEAVEKDYPPLVKPEDLKILDRVGLTELRERFAMADYLAGHFQKRRHHFVLKMIIFLAALIAFVHQLVNSNLKVNEWFDVPPSIVDGFPGGFINLEEGWPYVFYGLLIFLGYVSVMIVRRHQWQERYLDYRTIAEGTRIQFFWLISGIRAPVVNYFLRKQRDELEWIRNVLRLWYLRCIIGGGFIEDATPKQSELIQKFWIEDQYNYGVKASDKMYTKERILKKIFEVMLLILIITLVLQLFDFGAIAKSIDLDSWIDKWNLRRFSDSVAHLGGAKFILVVIGAAAGACALAASSFRHFFSYSELHKAHSRMCVLFADGHNVFEPKDGIQEDEREILEDLGRESLAEVGDWCLMNRKRKVNIPRGLR